MQRPPRQGTNGRPPTTNENAAGEHVGPKRRLHPAGQALIVGVSALLLGALLNAPGLRKTAVSLNPGWKRDVAMALTKPLLEVSQTLYLDRPREWLKEAMGRSQDDTIVTRITLPPVSTRPPQPAPPPPTRPHGAGTQTHPGGGGRRKQPREPRRPRTPVAPAKPAFSPSHPLRVYVGGDSLSIVPGYSLFRAMGGSKVYKPLSVDGVVSSGLERPDFHDWFTQIRQVMEDDKPNVVVVLFGGNDNHSYMTAGPPGYDPNTPFGSAAWVKEYRRRVAGFMDTVIDHGAFVVWLGLPIVRDAGLSHDYRLINRIYEQEAKKRPGHAAYVDLYDMFEDPKTAGYTEFLRGKDGSLKDVRYTDGIHFAPPGGDMIARRILGILNERFDLTSWKRTRR